MSIIQNTANNAIEETFPEITEAEVKKQLELLGFTNVSDTVLKAYVRKLRIQAQNEALAEKINNNTNSPQSKSKSASTPKQTTSTTTITNKNNKNTNNNNNKSLLKTVSKSESDDSNNNIHNNTKQIHEEEKDLASDPPYDINNDMLTNRSVNTISVPSTTVHSTQTQSPQSVFGGNGNRNEITHITGTQTDNNNNNNNNNDDINNEDKIGFTSMDEIDHEIQNIIQENKLLREELQKRNNRYDNFDNLTNQDNMNMNQLEAEDGNEDEDEDNQQQNQNYEGLEIIGHAYNKIHGRGIHNNNHDNINNISTALLNTNNEHNEDYEYEFKQPNNEQVTNTSNNIKNKYTNKNRNKIRNKNSKYTKNNQNKQPIKQQYQNFNENCQCNCDECELEYNNNHNNSNNNGKNNNEPHCTCEHDEADIDTTIDDEDIDDMDDMDDMDDEDDNYNDYDHENENQHAMVHQGNFSNTNYNQIDREYYTSKYYGNNNEYGYNNNKNAYGRYNTVRSSYNYKGIKESKYRSKFKRNTKKSFKISDPVTLYQNHNNEWKRDSFLKRSNFK